MFILTIWQVELQLIRANTSDTKADYYMPPKIPLGRKIAHTYVVDDKRNLSIGAIVNEPAQLLG